MLLEYFFWESLSILFLLFFLNTRKNYTFSGWNTRADGKGDAYAQGDDAAPLMAGAGEGQITLYAQWKINPPTIKSMKSTKPGTLKISYKKIPEAKKYQLQYSTNKKFPKRIQGR